MKPVLLHTGKPAVWTRSRFTKRRWRSRPAILRLITTARTRTKTWGDRKTPLKRARSTHTWLRDSARASHAWARTDENGTDGGSDWRISEDERAGRKLLS